MTATLVCLLTALGCRQDMYDQPRYEDYEPSGFFQDSAAVRPLPTGVVAQGWGRELDPHFFYGAEEDGGYVTTFPFEINREVLERGQERYNVFCAPCHNYTGNGQGMIVMRGFVRYPASLHEQRLREQDVGYFYDVITNGYGLMYGYKDRLHPEDRWAVVAYIRALQRSQDATMEDVPDDLRREVEALPSPAPRGQPAPQRIYSQ